MDCRNLTNDRLLDHADGIPDPAAAGHLPGCPSCADRLADLRAIASSLRGPGRRKRTAPLKVFALIGAVLLLVFIPIATNFDVNSDPIGTSFMLGSGETHETARSDDGRQRLVQSLGGELLRIGSFKLR